MEKIASFTIDHIKLQPGVYVSRKDHIGAETVTTFDIRMTSPNEEPVMNTAEIHTMEHLGATFLSNDPEWKERVIYFGPMGLVRSMYKFMADFEGAVPGASPKDCGNYLDMNLGMAKFLAKKFYDGVLKNIGPDRLIYPV